MVGSIVSVGILMKCTKVVGYQPIIPQKGQTCRGSKKFTPRFLYISKRATSRYKIDQSYL